MKKAQGTDLVADPPSDFGKDEISQALAKRDAGPLAVSAQPQDLMTIIARAAADPAVNVDKMERLYAMLEKENARVSEMAYNQAMCDCQAEIPAIKKDAVNPSTNSRFAQLESIKKIADPIIFKHGFSMQFSQGEGAATGMIRVLCKVSHRGGHSSVYQMDLAPDDKGPKGLANKTMIHGQGSTFSYGERYLRKLIFNITIVGEDDDGNHGNRPPPKGPSTVAGEGSVESMRKELWALLAPVGGTEQNWDLRNRHLIDEAIIDPEEKAPKFSPERFRQVIEKVKAKLNQKT